MKRGLAISLLLQLLCFAAFAEVSAVRQDNGYAGAVFVPAPGGTSETWATVRDAPLGEVLNNSGATNGDRFGVIVVNPTTNLPEAVWSAWDGEDFEVAWSRFNGSEWSPASLITDNEVDDVHPSLAIDQDGSRGIAWETIATNHRIFYRELSPQGIWSLTIPATSESTDSRSPAVGFRLDRSRIIYVEFNQSTHLPFAVAASVGDDGAPFPGYFTPEIIAMISFSGDIAPELHSYPNQLFTTWVNSSNEIGFARFDGTTWQTPQTETYTSAEDLPKARIRAKSRALQSP